MSHRRSSTGSWYNKKVIKAKQIRRQCERKWRHTSLQVHREIYKTQCAEVKRTIITANSDYYISEIEQCGCDNRRLYRLLNGLLQRRKSNYLPVNNNIHEPLPTWLLKDVSDNAVSFLTKLINSSIASGVVPCCLKHVNVTPVPKKANINQDNMNS